ncbi:histidine phosphatase family protein [Streptomyces massasporeus]|uniref:histidine phosphatase family protein n=1 Tax=Streptomyces massasporeus TaxID=67324 RepID=UPI0037140457
MNRSLRQARFDDGGALDEVGRDRAPAVAGALPPAARVVVSPGVRCRETAGALGLQGAEAAELAGLDVGRRGGRTLDEVAVAEPGAVGRWLTDPSCAPHGGESVRDACVRVGRRLDALRETDGRARLGPPMDAPGTGVGF